MTRRRFLFMILLAAPGAGACNDPVAQQRSLARQRSVVADIDAAQKWESERPPVVAADLREIGVIEREYQAKLNSDIQWHEYMYKSEVRDWNAKQGDRWRAIQREFAGDPKAAHDTAVQFLD